MPKVIEKREMLLCYYHIHKVGMSTLMEMINGHCLLGIPLEEITGFMINVSSLEQIMKCYICYYVLLSI